MNTEKWLKLNAASLEGKTVAITGSTGGLGKEICRSLASLGASLILLDRNIERSTAWKNELSERYGISVRCITLDLEDVAALGKVADELLASELDIFIHNAGAYSIPRHKCKSGYDNVFQINFASPYFLISRLLPMLEERGGRVVAVGSIAHGYSRTDPDDIDFSNRGAASKVYGNAKRYLMFSLISLFEKCERATLSITHPGITFTNITAHYPKLIYAIIKHPMKLIFMKPRTAALSIIKGVFEPCFGREWIGPSIFGIWGLPKKSRLKSVKDEEYAFIAKTAGEVYRRVEGSIN